MTASAFAVTFFRDFAARTKSEESLTLEALAERIERTSAASKDSLPWLKFARFGPLPNPATRSGSLRWNGNVLRISGITADYDGEQITPQEAADRLDKAGINGLVYTSPSHLLNGHGPRWRVCCPFVRELPTDRHYQMMARLNGLFDAKLAPESFTLSQAYYFGAVGNNAAHRAIVVDGTQCLDQADELDLTAAGKPNGNSRKEGAGADPQAPIEDIRAALAAMGNPFPGWPDDADWNQWNTVGMAVWRASGGSEEGFEAFDDWSALCAAKYDGDKTEFDWRRYHRSPPDQIGFGSLVHWARQVKPDWMPPSRRPPSPPPDFDARAAPPPGKVIELEDYRPQPTRRLEFIKFADIHPVLDTRALIKGYLGREEISLILGESGSGKTFFALDRDLHIAAGCDWFGCRVSQAAVIYLATEAGRGIQNRVAAWRREHGFEDSDIPFAAITTPIDLCHAEAGDLDLIVETVKRTGLADALGILEIDTVNRAMNGGNENSPDDMGAYVGNIDRLRDKLRCHVANVHHFGKDISRGSRGHNLLFCNVDTETQVISQIATITKQRDGVGGAQFPFTLTPVTLGIDQDGDPVTSCILEPVSQSDDATSHRRKPDTSKLSDKEKVALATLARALDAHGRVVHAHNYIKPGTVVVDLDLWRRFYLAGTSADGQSEDTRRKAWRRAHEGLQAEKVIDIRDEMVWII
jgi:hypothetical protein